MRHIGGRGRTDREVGRTRHRGRAGELQSEAGLVRDAQDDARNREVAALDDLIASEGRRAGAVDGDREATGDQEVVVRQRRGDGFNRAAGVAVSGDGDATLGLDVALEAADVEESEASLADGRRGELTEDVGDGDRHLRSGDLHVPLDGRDGGRTGQREVAQTTKDGGTDAGTVIAESEGVLDRECAGGKQARTVGHGNGAVTEGTSEGRGREVHGIGTDDDTAAGDVDAAGEGVLGAELQEPVARLRDAAVLDDGVDDQRRGERSDVLTGDGDRADVHRERRGSVKI